MGAARPRAVGPRAHRDPLPHRLPRLRSRCSARARRSPPARSSSGRSCGRSGSRCTRRSTPSTPSAGRSSTTSHCRNRRTRRDRQLAIDRRLLEEPRMEAHGVRDFPPDSLRGRFVRRALQAAVVDVILPAFAEQMLASLAAGAAPSRDLAARSTVYLQARTHYGVLDPAVLDPMRDRLGARARRLTTSPRSTSSTRASSGSPTATSSGSTPPPATYREIVGEPEQAPVDRGGPATRPGLRRRTESRPARPTWPTEASDRRQLAGLARRRARAGDRHRARRATRAARPRHRSRPSAARRGRRRPRPVEARAGPRHRAADRADARPRRRPPAVPGRGAARPPLRQPAAPGDDASAPGRSTSAPPAGGSTAAPTRAAEPSTPPDDRSARTRGGSSARSPPRSRSRTSG